MSVLLQHEAESMSLPRSRGVNPLEEAKEVTLGEHL